MRGIVALIAIIGVVLCIVLMGRSSSTPGPEQTPPGTGMNPGTAGVKLVAPARIVIECEEPTTIEDKLPDGKVIWKKVQQSEGVVIKFLENPDGWIEDWIKENPTERKALKGQAGALPGKASYVFEATRDDTYYISLRAKWLDNCGNSVCVKVDDSAWLELEDDNGFIAEKNFKWAWHQLYLGGRPKGFELKKGQHALWLCTREDGPKLDQWVISTDANAPIGDAIRK